MKIAVIGATGTVGRAVFSEFQPRHEVIEIGATRGAHRVDLTKIDSIHALFKTIGQVDAIVATAGHVHFGELTQMTPEQFRIGLDDKLMGQVNLVLVAQNYLNDGEEAREAFRPYFRGFEAASGARVALAYSRSVEGLETGRIYKVR